jgi:hypothetical protein
LEEVSVFYRSPGLEVALAELKGDFARYLRLAAHQEILTSGDAGKRHLFAFETFFNQYEARTLEGSRSEVALIITSPGSSAAAAA